MAEKAVKMQSQGAGTQSGAGADDPVAAQLDFLKRIVPEFAIHIVTIRRRQDPVSKGDTWVISPGSFHVLRGDLIYWSVAGNSAVIDLVDCPGLIGVESLPVPYNGTSTGMIGASAVGGDNLYRVHMAAGGDAVPDEGTVPTIIVDD